MKCYSQDELGNPAHRKWDMEAWMPGRTGYGEISSTSNCTDYQSRRLGIRLPSGDFAHTVNGTACAVPRMIISLCEQYQMDGRRVKVPDRLVPYMMGKETMQAPPKSMNLGWKYVQSPLYFAGRTKYEYDFEKDKAGSEVKVETDLEVKKKGPKKRSRKRSE